MSTTLREIQLGPEAMDYVRKCLESGRTLSKFLLQAQDLNCGRIVTKLPVDVDDEEASAFEAGGKLPFLIGKSATLQPVANLDSFLVEEIRNFLAEGESNVCIFEDASARPSDTFIKSLQTRFSILDDEIYHVLCPSDTEDDTTLKTIRNARSWLLLGAMTSTSHATGDLCSPKNELSVTRLKVLAQRTKKIIVGAYDGEGYIIWSRF